MYENAPKIEDRRYNSHYRVRKKKNYFRTKNRFIFEHSESINRLGGKVVYSRNPMIILGFLSVKLVQSVKNGEGFDFTYIKCPDDSYKGDAELKAYEIANALLNLISKKE